ncbi:LysR family transcriptional regulator [Methylocystis sp.]|uniref:LysR family transcriptional regulator n=1 Tax=Methylocystis sp. TaxID=1911079 RepID=UPI002732457F|nr:LysR family transcriptional regulator [Methylocystis sp.]MDP3555213.1 LysR substrate-binding domain-containing protein [Methylocystis sp.]
MDRLNYQHLYYFWMVAKTGSIKSACEALNLAQPTISGQLALFEKAIGSKVFKREGRKLNLTQNGWLVFNYAHEIFSVGDELTKWLEGASAEPSRNLKVGVCDGVDMSVALRLLSRALNAQHPPTLCCASSDAERVLQDLRLRAYDLAILTAPPACSDPNATSSHLLATLEISLFGPAAKVKSHSKGFPQSLHRAPVVLPIQKSSLRQSLDHWLQIHGIEPDIKSEIGNSELRKSVAASCEALTFAPTDARQEVRQRYGLEVIGAIHGVEERIYAVTTQRKIRNSAIAQIIGSIDARELFP